MRIRCLKKLSYSITAGRPCMKIAPIPRVPHSCSLTVKFQDMVYTLLSGHSLHLWDLRPALHSSGALGAEVDFAEQGVAEEDQYAMVDALECDGM